MISFPDITQDNFIFFARYVLSGFIIYLIRNARRWFNWPDCV